MQHTKKIHGEWIMKYSVGDIVKFKLESVRSKRRYPVYRKRRSEEILYITASAGGRTRCLIRGLSEGFGKEIIFICTEAWDGETFFFPSNLFFEYFYRSFNKFHILSAAHSVRRLLLSQRPHSADITPYFSPTFSTPWIYLLCINRMPKAYIILSFGLGQGFYRLMFIFFTR